MSSNYTYTENKYPIDYKIVKGLPEAVELEVKKLLKDGWVLNNAMQVIQSPSGVDIVVQCMIFYEKVPL